MTRHKRKQTHRLLLLKHARDIIKRATSCALQSIETKSISRDKAFDHLAQLSHTAVIDHTFPLADYSDKVLNIICESYILDSTEWAECAFSREKKNIFVCYVKSRV